MEQIAKIIPWVLPPLLGALIGFVTNKIAITMIFRPHREKKIFGLRVPFTPGIIPKQRLELSKSIGNMVSRELLTEDAVRKQTESSSFRQGMEQSVARSLEALFEKPLGELRGKDPEEAEGNISEGGARSLLSLIGTSFATGPGFSLLIKEAVSRVVAYVSAIPVKRLFPTRESRDKAVEKIAGLLTSAELESKVIAWVSAWMETHRVNNTPLSKFLSEDDITALVSVLDTLYPGIKGKVFEYLGRREVRIDLEKKGRTLLRSAIDRFSSFQRFFIMAGQFDRNLEENMGALVSDVLRALKETADKEETLSTLKTKAEATLIKFRDTGIGELFDRFPKMTDRINGVLRGLFAFLKRPGVREALSEGLSGIDRFEGETVGSLLRSLFKIELPSLEEGVISFILNRQDRKNLGSSLSPMLNRLLEDNSGLPLGDFLGIDRDARDRAGRILTGLLIGTINKKVPEILESVNINELVVDKIDSLDIAKMESLILDVVSKQLRWINIFGGILGAVIGMSQVILRLFNF